MTTLFFWSLPKLLLLLNALLDYKDKIIKLQYSIKMANQWFIIYNPHYNKIVINPTRTFVYTISYLYFRCNLNNLGNLLATFIFAYNSTIYITKPNIITKKETTLKILSIYMIDIALSKHLAMF